MPLVINSLGGGHTHTHTCRHHGQKQFQETSHTPAKGQHATGLKIRIIKVPNQDEDMDNLHLRFLF